MCRYGDTCSAVVIGTSSGQVKTYVVAGDMTPTWAQGSPACHTGGRHYVAILSEVGLCGGTNAASLCYLESSLVSADSFSCLLHLLQLLLPNSIAGPGLSCAMHYCFDQGHCRMYRVLFRFQLLPFKGEFCQCCWLCITPKRSRMHAASLSTVIIAQRLAAACRCASPLLPRTCAGCETSCTWTCTCHHTQHQGSSSLSPAAVHKLQLHSDLSAPDICYAVHSQGECTFRLCSYDLSASKCHVPQAGPRPCATLRLHICST